MKHTQGKWYIQDHQFYISVRANTHDDSIEIANIGCPELNDKERANAKLIAAAPELVQSLKALFDLLYYVNKEGCPDIEYPNELIGLQNGSDNMGRARDLLIKLGAW